MLRASHKNGIRVQREAVFPGDVQEHVQGLPVRNGIYIAYPPLLRRLSKGEAQVLLGIGMFGSVAEPVHRRLIFGGGLGSVGHDEPAQVFVPVHPAFQRQEAGGVGGGYKQGGEQGRQQGHLCQPSQPVALPLFHDPLQGLLEQRLVYIVEGKGKIHSSHMKPSFLRYSASFCLVRKREVFTRLLLRPRRFAVSPPGRKSQ